MIKEHLKAIDTLTAPQSAVDKALEAAREAQSGKVIEMKRTNNKRRFTLIAAMAAALAVVIGVGSAVLPRSAREQLTNSFSLTANAAELNNKLDDKDIIGAFEGDGGSALMDDPYNRTDNIYESGNYYKDGYIDTFWEFNLSKLRIKGENIESVSLKSESEGVYFSITPTSGFDYDEFELSKNGDFYFENGRSFHIDKKQIKKLEQLTKEKKSAYTYSDTLRTSQYTKDEFKKYGDGFGGENICDGFTFADKKKTQEINLDRDINLVCESIHSDPEIAGWLNRLREIEKQVLDAKLARDDAMLDSLYEKKDAVNSKIIRKTVTGAKLTLTVKFTDGTEQSKALDLAYAPIKGDDYFPCVTFK